MSVLQGIEQPPPPPPPYSEGDLIYDRIALNGPAYPVLECNPTSPIMRDAKAGAHWQVIFELPTGHPHYVWVDDYGYTPASAFGPEPRQQDMWLGDLLRGPWFDPPAGGEG